MTNEKQFRELKFTSTQLALVFLAILAFGVCIFLLGISVGKKQTQLVAESGGVPTVKAEAVAQKTVIPADAAPTVTIQQPQQAPVNPPETKPAESKTEAKPEPKLDQKQAPPAEKRTDDKAAAAKGKPAEVKPAPDEKKAAGAKTEPAEKTAKLAAAKQEGIFYVQIGAGNDKDAVDVFAQKVEKLGYPTLVLMPQAGDKKPVYRIRIGPYDTKQAATDAQEKIAADLKKKKTDFFIVKG